MKIVNSKNITCLESSPELYVKIHVKGKREYYTLLDTCGNVICSRDYELGNSVVEFIYDSMFYQIINFLDISEEMVRAIKSNTDCDRIWPNFARLVDNLLYNNSAHPFYYLLIVEIINAYKLKMMNKSGAPLPDDHFVKFGKSICNLKDDIAKLLEQHNHIEEGADTLHGYKDAFTSTKVTLPPLQAELIKVSSEFDSNESYEIQAYFSPQKPQEIWNYLLTLYAMSGIRFKRCENCLRFFATTGRGSPIFCDRIIPGENKTCRQLIPKLKFNTKAKNDPALRLYNRAYKTMYSRIIAKKISKDMFHKWAKQARDKRDDCSKGKITIEEFSEWICDSGLYVDYLKSGKL